jgi:circadian clock protein KaiB
VLSEWEPELPNKNQVKIIQRRRQRQVHDATTAFERLAEEAHSHAKYLLRLYVAGNTANSSRAIANVRRICEQHLAGRYDLEVVDLYQQPVLSKGEQIVAVPTLIKKLPMPLRKFIGDMSNTERILVGLDLRPSNPEPDGDGVRR